MPDALRNNKGDFKYPVLFEIPLVLAQAVPLLPDAVFDGEDDSDVCSIMYLLAIVALA